MRFADSRHLNCSAVSQIQNFYDPSPNKEQTSSEAGTQSHGSGKDLIARLPKTGCKNFPGEGATVRRRAMTTILAAGTRSPQVRPVKIFLGAFTVLILIVVSLTLLAPAYAGTRKRVVSKVSSGSSHPP